MAVTCVFPEWFVKSAFGWAANLHSYVQLGNAQLLVAKRDAERHRAAYDDIAPWKARFWLPKKKASADYQLRMLHAEVASHEAANGRINETQVAGAERSLLTGSDRGGLTGRRKLSLSTNTAMSIVRPIPAITLTKASLSASIMPGEAS